MVKRRMKTSVVMACYNSEKTLARCLDSIICNSPDEIVAVNDKSSDRTLQILKGYEKTAPLKIVDLKKRSGVATAESEGVMKATGDIILMTNSDCYVPHDWISSVLKHYDDPKVGAVGGPRLVMGKGLAKAVTLSAGNSSFRRKILEETGGIEEGSYAGEDSEFYLRIKDRGYKVIRDNSIVVLHDHQVSFSDQLRKNFRYGIRGGQIIRRYPHGKHMSKYFLIPVFWFPFRDIPPMLKQICIRMANNIGKFFGFFKG